MKFTPRPYQKLIIDKILSTPRCAIWAGMGLGKTVATLTAIAKLKQKALIIAPLRVAKTTWPSEVAKWDHLKHLRVSVIAGTPAWRRRAIGQDADIYCVNYENLPWLVDTLGASWPYRLVIADEATRLKGFRLRQGSVRAKALAKVSRRLIDRFVELTGTPAPNGLVDLWGQAWFLDFGDRLGASFRAYTMKYFTPERVANNAFAIRWIPHTWSAEAIRKALSDVSMTINAEDYFDVGQNIVNEIGIDLPSSVMKIYHDLGNELYLELANGAEITAANAAVKVNKLLQIASGAVYFEGGYEVLHREKIEALKSVVEEANGAPVLCAYSYKHEVARILSAFPEAVVLDKNPQTVARWNRGEIPLLLAHPASCGHGLNLQDGGNILVFFSLGWSLEQHDQIIERIGAVRQQQSGNNRPAFIHYLIANDTVDEAVRIRLKTKRNLQDVLLDRADLLRGKRQ